MSSLEFSDRTRVSSGHSWYGSTRTKRILHAMWACGILLTHHRKAGRHYYDRPERVIPALHYQQKYLTGDDYHRWIIAQRYQAVGLLRPTAEACIWSACGDGPVRKRITAELVEAGTLTSVLVGEKRWQYYIPTAALSFLESEKPYIHDRMLFLGPLDNLLWDRKTLQQIFQFDYIWEVYKPAEQRRWGYYVLPVFYRNRFVARFDSRLQGQTWRILRWWWEPGISIDADLQAALVEALERFLVYLGATSIVLDENEPILYLDAQQACQSLIKLA